MKLRSHNFNFSLEQAVEWRAALWAPAVESALMRSLPHIVKNPTVLELGYNTGAMSCYLAQQYGWRMIGYEVEEKSRIAAITKSKLLGVDGKVDFRCCPADKTFAIQDKFDVIFIKSFLYHNKDLSKYQQWLRWFFDRLKCGGVLIAIENGSGHIFDRVYRQKINQSCSWKDNILFDSKVEMLFQEIFTNVEVEYFGGISQYLTSLPLLCKMVQKFERIIGHPKADNCFIASIVAHK